MQCELENKFPPSPKQPITHINRTRGLPSIFPRVQHILSRHAVPEIPHVIGSRGVSVDMAEEGEQDQSHEDQSTRAQLLLGQAPTLLRLNRNFAAYLISGLGGVVKVLETGVGVLASVGASLLI